MTNSRLPGSSSTTIPQPDRYRAQAPPPSCLVSRPPNPSSRPPHKLVERQRAPVSNGHNLGRLAASSPAPPGKDEEPPVAPEDQAAPGAKRKSSSASRRASRGCQASPLRAKPTARATPSASSVRI